MVFRLAPAGYHRHISKGVSHGTFVTICSPMALKRPLEVDEPETLERAPKLIKLDSDRFQKVRLNFSLVVHGK